MDWRIGDHLLLGFEGTALPDDVAADLAAGTGYGVTLFRHANVASIAQVRELADAVRRAAGRPVLVCVDQEGGQFLGLGHETTPFAGNLALGAVDDTDLTRRVGRAIGREVRAAGVDVDYAPVCDLLTTPTNPGLGIRTFGDDPARVGQHVAAFTAGLAEAGAIGCAKHFPGKGDATVDSHHALPVLEHDADRLDEVELVPFRAAIEAGVGMVMTSHAAYPALTGDADLPGTLSPQLVTHLLRGDLGFAGVTVTDALDMKALGQGAAQVVDAIAALRAGADLLLMTAEPGQRERLVEGLGQAVARRLVDPDALRAGAARVAALAATTTADRPPVDVVGSSEHHQLAAELARRSITLLRDPGRLLPLAASSRVLAVMPRPFDRTPADTSSTVAPGLGPALARRFASVEVHVTSPDPTRDEIAAVVRACPDVDAVVVGLVDAHAVPGQQALVEAVAGAHRRVVSVSMRVPLDATMVPASTTHLCSYGLLPPSLHAVADALAGAIPVTGRLPARMGELPRGAGLQVVP